MGARRRKTENASSVKQRNVSLGVLRLSGLVWFGFDWFGECKQGQAKK